MPGTGSHLSVSAGRPLASGLHRKGESTVAALPPQAIPRASLCGTTSIHSGAIAVPLTAAAYLVVALWVTFAGGETSLVLAIVTLILFFMFGLMAGCGAYADVEPDRAHSRSFREFLNGAVDIETGRLTGYTALWQIVTLPTAVAVGWTLIMICYAVTPA
jgi:hypothetical protein